MAEQFLVHDKQARTSAATHAVVIGVGAYPHLLGGSSKQRMADHGGLKQLTSPPLSARAFASWLIESYEHPEKPLASVSLLLSEHKPKPFVNPRTKDTFEVALADAGNARKALRDWFHRGFLNPNNLLLFFFCGHGLAAGTETALLLSDFGADPLASLDGAIDFRAFRNAMKRCRASEQCFFVDACRTESDLLTQAGRAGFSPIDRGPRDGAWPKLKAPVFYSTTHGFPAYAVRKGRRRFGPSLYTDALLQSLQDLAAADSTGDWRVNTGRLFEAIDHVLSRRLIDATRTAPPPTADDAAIIDLNRLTAPPKALVYIRTEPLGRLGDMSVEYAQNGSAKRRARPEAPHNTELVVPLPAGHYDFTAIMRGSRSMPLSLYVFPISRTLKFNVPP